MININFEKDSIMFKKIVKMVHLLTSNSHQTALLFYESDIFWVKRWKLFKLQ